MSEVTQNEYDMCSFMKTLIERTFTTEHDQNTSTLISRFQDVFISASNSQAARKTLIDYVKKNIILQIGPDDACLKKRIPETENFQEIPIVPSEAYALYEICKTEIPIEIFPQDLQRHFYLIVEFPLLLIFLKGTDFVFTNLKRLWFQTDLDFFQIFKEHGEKLPLLSSISVTFKKDFNCLKPCYLPKALVFDIMCDVGSFEPNILDRVTSMSNMYGAKSNFNIKLNYTGVNHLTDFKLLLKWFMSHTPLPKGTVSLTIKVTNNVQNINSFNEEMESYIKENGGMEQFLSAKKNFQMETVFHFQEFHFLYNKDRINLDIPFLVDVFTSYGIM